MGSDIDIHLLTSIQPLPAGKPWGQRDSKTNYYTEYPITGVDREYDWTITKQNCAPDGVKITCLLVNGQFPGKHSPFVTCLV